jgi:transcriptional regulator with XRE-family HTH domain
METTFPEWLASELEKRDMRQVDLAKKSGVATAQISRILSGQRGTESKTLLAIAKALSLPPEQVYRAAGILPPAINIDEDMERILHETEKLPKADREEVLAYIRMKNNLRKRK